MAHEMSFKIVAGPSKFDLMTALFAKGATNPLEFSLKGFLPDALVVDGNPPRIKKVRLSSVEREDGSGESWNLKGWVDTGGYGSKFKAYYDTRNRGGYFEILSNS